MLALCQVILSRKCIITDLFIFSANNTVVPPVNPIPSASSMSPDLARNEDKSITVYLEDDQDQDSEKFPWEIRVRNIADLKKQLLDICGFESVRQNVIIILKDLKEAINSLEKIVDKSTYGIKYKGKESIIKLYLTRR